MPVLETTNQCHHDGVGNRATIQTRTVHEGVGHYATVLTHKCWKICNITCVLMTDNIQHLSIMMLVMETTQQYLQDDIGDCATVPTI